MEARDATAELANVMARDGKRLLDEWVREQLEATSRRRDLVGESQIRQDSSEFARLLREALERSAGLDIEATEWGAMRTFLGQLSDRRSAQGFSPSETATFVFSFKRVLFERLRGILADDTRLLVDTVYRATLLLDALGLYTTEVYQRSREAVIHRQQEEMLELSTPVVKLWDGVLALPLIGTLDSARTQTVMESLLERVVETGADVAIIDITGVPTVDTLVAQHLLKTITAARLMGTDCIISGIRPQIAATIVHLGVDLSDVVTKSTLADAFKLALAKTGAVIDKSSLDRA